MSLAQDLYERVLKTHFPGDYDYNLVDDLIICNKFNFFDLNTLFSISEDLELFKSFKLSQSNFYWCLNGKSKRTKKKEEYLGNEISEVIIFALLSEYGE